jgi:nucleolar protein 12
MSSPMCSISSADEIYTQPLQKQLKRHVLSFVPNARVESMRFRSIAFQKPTAKLPTSDDESSKPSQGAAAPKPKEGRAHDRNRAATWRENQDKDDIALKNDEKKFLRPEEKKKIAFIKGELHNSAATANAYIVFAHPSPSTSPASTEDAEDSNAEGDIKTGEQQTDPYEASRMAVQHANGSQFMERTIRVDFVNAKSAGGDATEMITSDPKRTVFVGNLEFAAKEEDLRVFFEGVVSTELGPPPSVPGDETGVAKLASWVTRVRIVRDKDTQLGKGFAYVQFVVCRYCLTLPVVTH